MQRSSSFVLRDCCPVLEMQQMAESDKWLCIFKAELSQNSSALHLKGW